MEAAKQCGLQALEHNPDSAYTYDLLGAIFYQSGQPQKGDEYLQKAWELGAPTEAQQRDIRRAVDNSDDPSRRRAAKYLLLKDPVKLQWAKHCLAYFDSEAVPPLPPFPRSDSFPWDSFSPAKSRCL